MVDTKCLIRYSLFDVNAVGLIGEARDLSLILNIMNPSSDGEGKPGQSVSDRCKLLLGLWKGKHCTMHGRHCRPFGLGNANPAPR